MARHPEGGTQPPEQRITLEYWLNKELMPRYRAETDFLRRATVLKTVETSRGKYAMGLRDINGVGRPFPNPDQITAEVRRHKEVIEHKLNQGFIRLGITPLGARLSEGNKLVGKKLLELHKIGKLLGTNYDESGQPRGTKLDLDTNQPLYVWDALEQADENGKLVYFPTQFTSQNHGGKTKTELLEDPHNPFPGWEVQLLPATPFIPRAGKGRTIGGRKELEAGKSPNAYLAQLSAETAYANESGQTPEDEQIELLRSLYATGHVIHDYANNADSINYHLGAWVPSSGNVPYGLWHRDARRAYFSGGDPRGAGVFYGGGSAVRINRLGV